MSVVRMSKTKENCSDGCADISNCLEDNAPILGGTFCVAALIIAIVLLSVSFETISSSEVGLAYDNVWASLNDKILTEGLVSKPPFGSVLRWPKLYQTVSYTNTTAIICNSLDGIKITLDFSFQFVPDTNKIYNLTLTFKDFPTYSDVIQVQARSSARDVCGDFTAEEFQTRRAEVGQKLEEEVKTKIKQIWFSDVVDLQLRNIDRPDEYEQAIQNKESARSDIKLAENERQQALVVAQTKLERAQQQARINIDTAATQANITIAFSQAKADAMLDKFTALAESYAAAQKTHNLTSEGILAYISNQVLLPNENQTMAHDLPAQVSYKDEL